MTQKTDSILSQWLKSRQITLEELLSRDLTKAENVSYEGLSKLTRIQAPYNYTAYYFFDINNQFAILYVGDEDYLTQLSLEVILKTYGEPEAILRSRAGKSVNHYAYPEHGFAFSKKRDALILFEVFPNCTLDAYKKNIYVEPPVFRK